MFVGSSSVLYWPPARLSFWLPTVLLWCSWLALVSFQAFSYLVLLGILLSASSVPAPVLFVLCSTRCSRLVSFVDRSPLYCVSKLGSTAPSRGPLAGHPCDIGNQKVEFYSNAPASVPWFGKQGSDRGSRPPSWSSSVRLLSWLCSGLSVCLVLGSYEHCSYAPALFSLNFYRSLRGRPRQVPLSV